MKEILLSLDDTYALARRCLEHNGCNTPNADAVAKVIKAAERDGCHSHGLMRLPGYAAALQSGKVNGNAEPVVSELAPAVVRVDGDSGFAPLALQASRQALIESATRNGIAALCLTNIHHFAALWTEIEPIVESGLCAYACVSYKPAVIPAGGTQALYGTNPFAFGWPRRGKPPLIFDQASSVMARGEVMLAAREGHELPAGVGVDAEGAPSTDPEKVLDGALLAFGGHKGSSIAMMIELLAGPLIGECLSTEAAERDNNDGGPPRGGELIVAINPNRFGDADGWADHAEKLFANIIAQDGARLPSDRRHAARGKSTVEGISIPSAVHEKLVSLCGVSK